MTSDTNKNKLWTKFRSTFFLFGLCCTLLIVFSAFQVVVPYQDYEDEIIDFETLPDAEVTPPPTRHHTKKRVTPPKEVVKKIQLDIPLNFATEEFVEDESDPIDSWEDDDFSEEYIVEEKKDAGKIEIKETEEDVIVIFAGRMPVFGDCREIVDDNERDKCSQKSLYDYIYKNVHFPSLAKEVGIDGRVTASIVVDKFGKVNDIKILQHPGGGLDQAVLKVLENMPDWQAGMNNFKAVNVRYTIPVKFTLE